MRRLVFHRARWGILCCLALLSAHVTARADSPSPQQVLEQAGLVRLSGANLWITEREAGIRRRLSDARDDRQAIERLEQSLVEHITQNLRRHEAWRQTLAALRAALTRADDAGKRMILARIAALEKEEISPERLSNQPDVRHRIIELANRRNSLWLDAAWVRREYPKLEEEYAALRQNAQVSETLTNLARHKLGPAKNYEAELKDLAVWEQAALTDWVPLYLQGGRQRLSAILNETTPATFTWSSSPEPIVITSSMAHTAGLEISRDAAKMSLTLASGRTYDARQVKIPYLRLGTHVLKDVEAYVLPPEGEDLGARLTPAALEGLRYEAQPERLRLVIEEPK